MEGPLEDLRHAQRLAESGSFRELLDFLAERPAEDVQRSPGLSVLHAIALARLGDHAQGERWARRALRSSRRRGDPTVEVRALNVCGAIAFEGGRIDEASRFFAEGLTAAEANHDHATAGRCSNNLGNIAYLQGDWVPALGYYRMATAWFERAGWRQGLGEVWHNVASIHRERGETDLALEASDRAVDAAQKAGDRNLVAQARAGRAEAHLAGGNAMLARSEIESAREMHQDLEDDVREQEDRRIQANVSAALGDALEAESILRDVISRARDHSRPLLVAMARRDLASLLLDRGDTGAARELAHSARVGFERLSARAETRKLDDFLRRCTDESRRAG